MATLEQRLADLVAAIGADIKALLGRAVPTGGAVGQVLGKTGPADGAVGWVAAGGGSAETFDQSRWSFNDFTGPATAAGVIPFAFVATSGGAIAVATGMEAPTNGVLSIRDSSTAGGGGTLENGVPMFAGAGCAFRAVFRTPGIAAATARIGCSNSFSAALGNNFAFAEIVGLTVTCSARRNVSGDAEVVDPAPVTLTANTAYVLDIDWMSATEVRFVLWELASGTVIKHWTAVTAAWPNPSASSIRFGARATESTTSAAADILFLDYIGFGPARPGSCPVPNA